MVKMGLILVVIRDLVVERIWLYFCPIGENYVALLQKIKRKLWIRIGNVLAI